MQDVDSLKQVIEAPSFVKNFGPARPDGRGKGERCNVFGHDDMLKVRPKGVDKDHPSIDYLKLRSVAVVRKWVLTRLGCDGATTDLPKPFSLRRSALQTKKSSHPTLWTR